MDHLGVLRDKVGRLREEIADIQELNEQFRRDGWNGVDAQVAHGQRNERLQAIQHELVRLADLVSTEQMCVFGKGAKYGYKRPVAQGPAATSRVYFERRKSMSSPTP